jgi:hypothetical protein
VRQVQADLRVTVQVAAQVDEVFTQSHPGHGTGGAVGAVAVPMDAAGIAAAFLHDRP